MRRLAFIVLLICLGLGEAGAVRRALVVTIGDYPPESGWNKLESADNDREIVTAMLSRLGFRSPDIISLHDADATYEKIVGALDALSGKTLPGDEVYVHFSCHGQQITDLDGDEALRDPKDRYDEALVPYDAFISYGWRGYKGDRHLLDDELGSWLERISAAAGKKGSVLLIADACHSGGIQRGRKTQGVSFRGTYDRFELPLVVRGSAPEPAEATWVTISACKDFQTNFEVTVEGRRYGRLSYAVSRVLRPGLTPESLVKALMKEYDKLPFVRKQSLSKDIPKFCSGKPLFK